jgi:glutaminyl-peptide cyclotransferase
MGKRLVLTAAWLALACDESNRERALEERTAFDGRAALELVERQVAFGPRVPNTPAHGAALEFLRDYLSARADSVTLEEFQHVPLQGDTLRLVNVIASFAPAASRRVLLAAHWDTRPVAERDPDPHQRSLPIPGANDGASGVAVLLALADVLFANPLPDHGVDLVLLDGEDYGHEPGTLRPRVEDMFLGAREFARRHADYRPVLGILLDLVGDHDPVFRQEGYSLQYAPELVRLVWVAAADLGYAAFEACRQGQITDDHLFLNRAGIRTAAILDLDYDAWHTQQDGAANVSAGTLDVVGDVLVEILYGRLRELELAPAERIASSRAAEFEPVPEGESMAQHADETLLHGSPSAGRPRSADALPCK